MVTDLLLKIALEAEPVLCGKLARYNFGDGLAPAIFTGDVAPRDAGAPFLLITVENGKENSGGQGFDEYEVLLNVTLWGDKASEEALRLIAFEFFALFHHSIQGSPRRIDADGLVVWFFCSYPESVKDVDGFPGYQFNMRASALVS